MTKVAAASKVPGLMSASILLGRRTYWAVKPVNDVSNRKIPGAVQV
ncbi:Uncharacterised protein [Alcaligenes faecalis]|jgi:hypothetical protein|nr:hypothetical protein AFA2_03323 [Alcaligenes faecalis subsp. faecalis NBRC 13111]CUI85560.1 Uncharacterised protein [Alcaligenes faecalis]